MSAEAAEPAATMLQALARIGGADPGASPFALGWATVDLDRTERAFTDTLAGQAMAVADAPDDVALGARCRVVTTDLPGLPFVVLLEPSTEGRLAASLARHGEGPVAAWLRPDPDDATSSERANPSRPDDRGSEGPFGSEILLPGTPASGPHRLLVRAWPGTITP